MMQYDERKIMNNEQKDWGRGCSAVLQATIRLVEFGKEV
jgi:hypothetical protein